MVDVAENLAPIWESVVAVLAWVDDLPEDATGELAFGDDGAVFVEDRRICWAAARPLVGRLSELLRQNAGMSPNEFRACYARCRADGHPIGQWLVEQGRLSPTLLRSTLLQHSVESLLLMCRSEPQPSWQPRARRGYSAHFTFYSVELLLASSAVRFAEQRVAAETVLASFGEPGELGAAFAPNDDGLGVIPIAALSPARHGVGDLLALGEWGASATQAARELGEEANLVVGMTQAEQAIAVWWHDGILFAVPCIDRRELAVVTARHLSLGA